MSIYAIQVEGLGKEYIIGGVEQRHDSFREMLTSSLKSPIRRLRKLGGTASEEERFWALRDVSFKVKPGEVVGIIGRNGAGKSTLLKVLSRITSPTSGRVVTRGRMASLLEVGTGFHPELTGRENIYLNGAILGMSRRDIGRRFEEIVEFSEIERFLDTPVKRYSSGMYVRLAFSVAAHLETDVLLVDEVLAVGDAQFQQRCLGKMGEVAGMGRTIVFVSHNMGMISKLCSRGIVLLHGCLEYDDTASRAIAHYYASASKAPDRITSQLLGDFQSLVFEDITVNGMRETDQPIIRPCDPLDIRIRGQAHSDLEACRITVVLKKDGTVISSLYDSLQPELMHKGSFRSSFKVPEFLLAPGPYTISVGGFSSAHTQWRWATDVLTFTIATEWFPEYDVAGKMGVFNLPSSGVRESIDA